MNTSLIEKSYQAAREKYSELGVDTEKAIDRLKRISVSIHCWQGDDVGGFETPDAGISGGGIQATGNYPGKARNIDELCQDLDMVYSLVPGTHRLNLHASYGDFKGETVDRDRIEPGHFRYWLDWGRSREIMLDFNSTCFSHPLADGGFTLASKDPEIRNFWIEHVNRCRLISDFIGKQQGSRCIHNIWIPDGSKDDTVDRYIYRKHLAESLDRIFEKEYPPEHMTDSLESKLFGIASESFVAGSHEFYLGYAITRNKMICIDMGHFHPTESVGEKVSALLQFTDELMFHYSRGVRWDSDHVITLNDATYAMCHEIVRAGVLDRVNIGLDFFDASINRIGAWVVGTRATQISFLQALLEPLDKLREYENSGQLFERLALMEEAKKLPFGDVWDYFCLKMDVPPGADYLNNVRQYEKEVCSKRN